MLWSDLGEIKSMLDIDPADHSEDRKLLLLLERVSEWIGELLNRPGFSKKSRTEYYSGTGSQKLLLNSRPVFLSPLPQVWVDDNGFFGSVTGSFDPTTATFTYGTDFALKVDQEDGTSHSGILIRLHDYWPKPQIRIDGLLAPSIGEAFGNIKVTYTAGWTVDTLPAQLRMGCDMLVARMAYFFPLAMEVGGENYEERSVSLLTEHKSYIISPTIRSVFWSHRNWRFW